MASRHVLKLLLGLVTHAFDSLLLLAWAWRWPERRAGTLMIVRVDRIGDAILWLPAHQRIVDAHRRRGGHTLVVAGDDCADLIRDTGLADEVWGVDRDALRINPLYRAAVLGRVARYGAEVALQPTYSRIPSLGDAIVRFSGADRRIAWSGDNANTSPVEKRLGDRAYTELFPAVPGETSELRRNESLLDRLGVAAGPAAAVPLPRRPFTRSALPRTFFVLAPGASRGLKQWPGDRFAAIADRIHRRTGWTAVVCGGGGDRPLAAAVARTAACPVLDLTGGTTLGELADVVGRAALVVANDTAIVHVAAAVGTPCVSVTGGGQPGRFLPYPDSRLAPYRPPRSVVHPMPCFGCDWRCRYRSGMGEPAPCIEGITVDAVWRDVDACLDTAAAASCAPPP